VRFTFTTAYQLTAGTKYWLALRLQCAQRFRVFRLRSHKQSAISEDSAVRLSISEDTWVDTSGSYLCFVHRIYTPPKRSCTKSPATPDHSTTVRGEQAGETDQIIATQTLPAAIVQLTALSTDHTGFSGGSSHPYTSGAAATYTVQTELTP